MFNMIKADLYRIFKGKGLYIAITVMAIAAVFSIIAMCPGHIGLDKVTEDSYSNSIKNEEVIQQIKDTNSLIETRKIVKEHTDGFPLDKQIIGTNVNLYYFFIVIVALVLVTDFSNSTIKNTLSSAISRKKYYLSKAVICFGIGTFLILLNNYGIYICDILINGSKFATSFIEITKLTLMQMPLLYGIMSLLLCIGFCTKKMATFNGIAIPFLMAFQLIIMGIISLFKFDGANILQYEFQYAMGNLASSPTSTYIMNCALLGLIYIVIFNIIGYNIFKRTEIK